MVSFWWCAFLGVVYGIWADDLVAGIAAIFYIFGLMCAGERGAAWLANQTSWRSLPRAPRHPRNSRRW